METRDNSIIVPDHLPAKYPGAAYRADMLKIASERAESQAGALKLYKKPTLTQGPVLTSVCGRAACR
jgi:hypothetical protein